MTEKMQASMQQRLQPLIARCCPLAYQRIKLGIRRAVPVGDTLHKLFKLRVLHLVGKVIAAFFEVLFMVKRVLNIE
jgi:hypothetical protein